MNLQIKLDDDTAKILNSLKYSRTKTAFVCEAIKSFAKSDGKIFLSDNISDQKVSTYTKSKKDGKDDKTQTDSNKDTVQSSESKSKKPILDDSSEKNDVDLKSNKQKKSNIELREWN